MITNTAAVDLFDWAQSDDGKIGVPRPSKIRQWMGSISLGALGLLAAYVAGSVYAAGAAPVIEYVQVPADATAAATRTTEAQRPIRVTGAGDSSMAWNLADAMADYGDTSGAYQWVTPDDPEGWTTPTSNSMARLGCPITRFDVGGAYPDGPLQPLNAWNPTGAADCNWSRWLGMANGVDVIVASWGATALWDRGTDRGTGDFTNILDPETRGEIAAAMDLYERSVAPAKVLWIEWHTPLAATWPDRVAAWDELVRGRDCWTEVGWANNPATEPDRVHLSTVGAANLAVAIAGAVRDCWAGDQGS